MVHGDAEMRAQKLKRQSGVQYKYREDFFAAADHPIVWAPSRRGTCVVDRPKQGGPSLLGLHMASSPGWDVNIIGAHAPHPAARGR